MVNLPEDIAMPPDHGAVLIVDDDSAVRNALKFALEMEGFDVRTYNGPEALLADQRLPDRGCVVVDHRAPAIDGLGLIDGLRARHVPLPVILVVSDHSSEKLRHEAERAGAQGVLEKPLSDGALIESIRHAFAASARH
jgi:FixJ family two-component response regulator